MKRTIATVLTAVALMTPMTAQAEPFVNPLPERIQNECKRQAYEHCMPAELYEAIGIVETNGDEKAIGDGGNAYGFMQIWYIFQPDKMDRYNFQPEDLLIGENNVKVGADILDELFEKYIYPELVLLHYNGASDAEYRFETGINSEYVEKVQYYMNKLQEGQ